MDHAEHQPQSHCLGHCCMLPQSPPGMAEPLLCNPCGPGFSVLLFTVIAPSSHHQMQHRHGSNGAAVSLHMMALHKRWLHSGQRANRNNKERASNSQVASIVQVWELAASIAGRHGLQRRRSSTLGKERSRWLCHPLQKVYHFSKSSSPKALSRITVLNYVQQTLCGFILLASHQPSRLHSNPIGNQQQHSRSSC